MRRSATGALALVFALSVSVCAFAAPGLTPGPFRPPLLSLRVGFGGSVSSIGPTGEAPPAALAGLACNTNGAVLLVPPTHDATNGNRFCATATTQGLSVAFVAALPFVTPRSINCTELRGTEDALSIISVEARIGRGRGAGVTFDGARAQCDIAAGFAYALSVETQGTGTDAQGGGIIRAGADATRTIVIPWSLLHLNHHATSLLVRIGGCGTGPQCATSITQIVIPVAVIEGSASVGLSKEVFVRLATPQPRPAATPFRAHALEADAAFNWDVHDIVSTTFAQDAGYVTNQRALAQALSLAPVTLPVTSPAISVNQTLQVQSQNLFAFQLPSTYLEDPSLKPLFDITPFSVTRIGTLASGYAYGYTSDNVKGALFYGLQGPGAYAGSGTLSLALATPKPSPNPSPTPTPPSIIGTAAQAPQFSPLRPPPPPAPIVESGTASVPPFAVQLINGFSGGPNGRDNVDGLAFESHVYENHTTHGNAYAGETFNLFGRIVHDFVPSPVDGASVSQFIGESATSTYASTSAHPSFVQVRETIGAQQNNPYFSPSLGSVTWIAPLTGPVGHVTLSYATGPQARFFAVDLIGFRLTNTNGDIATQAGWQVSVPLPNILHATGWLLSGGSLVQTVSARMAALEQGVVPSYATAVAEVPSTIVYPQRLVNALLLSPWLGRDVQVSFTAGYDSGTTVGCGVAKTKPVTVLQCVPEFSNRVVGGVFLRNGPGGMFGIGVTDTAASQGNVTAGSAASNLGTSGALPGSIVSYITYAGCPRVSAAYTDAAFPSGVPLPQQGTTVSGAMDYPLAIRFAEVHAVLGYFNERTVTNAAFNQSGAFATLKISTPFQRVARPCSN